MLKTVDQLDLKEKRVFIRVDYNVGIEDDQIIDDSRIIKSLPTLEFALSQKAKIILASHRGRPEGKRTKALSLLPVAGHLSKMLSRDIIFPEDCIGDSVRKLSHDLREQQILLLENLRFHAEEEGNDPQFSYQLAQLAQVYVNDAFGVAHRSHASTVGMVGHFGQRGIGYLVKQELDSLSALLASPQRPFLAILGGSKVSDKIEMIENLMNHVDIFLIGGVMANTFLKAQGFSVGKSLVEKGKIHRALNILQRAEDKGIEMVLPIDVALSRAITPNQERKILRVKDDWQDLMALDIGPETLALFGNKIEQAETIFWNGPLGVFEVPPFNEGTHEVALKIANRPCISVVGGGDSLTAIRKMGIEGRFTHLSTGGGASMEFLEGKVLPGLKALEI